ncbi:MAG TPA: DUF2157 domain-containing protein, partial [Spirochaetota bacterium]|nr:DUF2157 domain-containing protein [Spirochaetota bacterium]
MRKLSKGNVDFILSEINYLKNDSIINEEIEDKIKNYYDTLLKDIEIEKAKSTIIETPKPTTNHFSFSMIILSIISGIFIAIGLITFIAINWHHIPREVKTVFAFIFLLIPAALSFYKIIIKKENYSEQFSEGISIFWALMFGGVFAFIGQIYRISGEFSNFILIWAISTIGIVYLYKSVVTLVFYAILVITWTGFSQYDN